MCSVVIAVKTITAALFCLVHQNVLCTKFAWSTLRACRNQYTALFFTVHFQYRIKHKSSLFCQDSLTDQHKVPVYTIQLDICTHLTLDPQCTYHLVIVLSHMSPVSQNDVRYNLSKSSENIRVFLTPSFSQYLFLYVIFSPPLSVICFKSINIYLICYMYTFCVIVYVTVHVLVCVCKQLFGWIQ